MYSKATGRARHSQYDFPAKNYNEEFTLFSGVTPPPAVRFEEALAELKKNIIRNPDGSFGSVKEIGERTPGYAKIVLNRLNTLKGKDTYKLRKELLDILSLYSGVNNDSGEGTLPPIEEVTGLFGKYRTANKKAKAEGAFYRDSKKRGGKINKFQSGGVYKKYLEDLRSGVKPTGTNARDISGTWKDMGEEEKG